MLFKRKTYWLYVFFKKASTYVQFANSYLGDCLSQVSNNWVLWMEKYTKCIYVELDPEFIWNKPVSWIQLLLHSLI